MNKPIDFKTKSAAISMISALCAPKSAAISRMFVLCAPQTAAKFQAMRKGDVPRQEDRDPLRSPYVGKFKKNISM